MGESARKFGRYEALFRIASGGMAEVFAGRVRGEGGFEKLVAIKRMLPHLADDPEFVAMFLDEARVAANVSSAHVVQTLDIGRTEDGALFIVMDLVLGLSLSELRAVARAREAPMPPEVCVDILAQAALGLHDAHEARTASGVLLGLVHRDVSPQNLLIGAEGRTRLTDFGIAHATQSRLTETEHGRIKGKFAYFSPEQSMGAELDRRSDIFALGIVGWEMLAGCRLFAREQPSDTIAAVRSGPIPQLDQVRPDLSPALVRVIDRALRRPAQRRYETARDMAEALRAVYGTGALGQTEAYVKELRPERIVQLEARIREAVGSPEIRTLPDIDVEAPAFEEPDITQLPSLGVTTNRKLRSEMPTMILGDATDALDRSPDSAEGRTRRTGLVIAAALALAIVGVVAFVSLSARPGEDSTPSSATELPLDPQLSPVVPAGAAAPQPEEAGENASGAETDATTASDRLPLASTSSMRARRGARAAPGMGSDDDSSPEATPMDRVPAGRAAGLELFDNASSMR